MTRQQASVRRIIDVDQASSRLGVTYSKDEDKDRTNQHYEQPPEYFTAVLGGEWHTYSCNLWDGSATETESQERKLDIMAELMELKRGQRVLDVGCGWGGPITYLAKRYGVRGVALTLSSLQHGYAAARVQRYGVPVSIRESHWRDYQDDEPFDAIYTDEAISHFGDLAGFFEKTHSLLRPGGRMVNKELHFDAARFTRINRAMVFINEIFGETGNYRVLHEELSILDRSGFDLAGVHQFPIRNYLKTLDQWHANMLANLATLEALTSKEHCRRFRTYLKIARRILAEDTMQLYAVVGRKPA
jgi:cyclopropane-fatty-acyl-phospholipid synthase